MLLYHNMPSSPSPGILFYQLNGCTQDGASLTDIWDYNYEQYERKHTFIQWVFPSDEPSAVNPYAPVVDKEFKEQFGSDLRERLLKSYQQFLDFIGLGLTLSGSIKVVSESRFTSRITRHNHNLLRITRVLRSLTVLGLHSYALTLYEFLLIYKKYVNTTTLDYWEKAILARL